MPCGGFRAARSPRIPACPSTSSGAAGSAPARSPRRGPGAGATARGLKAARRALTPATGCVLLKIVSVSFRADLSLRLSRHRSCREVFMSRRISIPCGELQRLYEVEHLGTVALARRYGCSPTTVSKCLRNCGIAVRASRFQARHVPADELRRLYMIERLPVRAIAQHFGVSQSTIGNRRRAFGIPVRPRLPRR